LKCFEARRGSLPRASTNRDSDQRRAARRIIPSADAAATGISDVQAFKGAVKQLLKNAGVNIQKYELVEAPT